ncbi:B12-binding domain-containing radical SAM protein [Pseudomonadota bacterium]
MRITLVQPPSNHEETFLLSPPLGLLSIAAVAEGEGAEVTLLDFNLKGLQDQRWQTAEYFYPHALEKIRETKPDIVGFTSMAIESHVGLQLAQELKEENPSIITLFGGPHFGAIATEMLEHYDWVDYVIAGEGEVPLQNLLRMLEGEGEVSDLSNIARRTDAGITFERRSMAARDLDELPFPAYHLVDMEEYFALNPSKLVCFEHARGCYLKCSFCYSPQHWGHGESRKSTERVLAELKKLKEMGIEELFWVSDNLLNSKDNAISLCEAINEEELQFKWHCYGTMPQITEPVVKALSSAGCQSIFVGVDAVAEDNKKKYKKSYFKGWDGLRAKLSLCLTNGITPTCAFMLSPLDTDEAREATLRIAAYSASIGCFVRLNALTYYNQTEIEPKANLEVDKEYSEAYAIVLFDTAEILIRNDYAELMPELFPFHRTFTEKTNHEDFAKYCRMAMQIINSHQFLLLVGILEHDFLVHSCVTKLNSRFRLEELSCRGLKDFLTRFNIQCALSAITARLGLPDDLIEIDWFISNSPYKQNFRSIKLDLNGHKIPLTIPNALILESRLDFQASSIELNSIRQKYLVEKNSKGIKIQKMSDNFRTLLESGSLDNELVF